MDARVPLRRPPTQAHPAVLDFSAWCRMPRYDRRQGNIQALWDGHRKRRSGEMTNPQRLGNLQCDDKPPRPLQQQQQCYAYLQATSCETIVGQVMRLVENRQDMRQRPLEGDGPSLAVFADQYGNITRSVDRSGAEAEGVQKRETRKKIDKKKK